MRAALALTIACSLAAPAAAARPEKARQLERQADEARKAGRFDEAFEGYRQAFIAHPAPRYFYRLGECEQGRGDDERALFFFQRYLDENAVPPFRDRVLRFVGEARGNLARERAARTAPRLAILPVRASDRIEASDAEALTERIWTLAGPQVGAGTLRDLDRTYRDLHLASLMGRDCLAAADSCVRGLMPLLSVDAVLVAVPAGERVTLRVVHADQEISTDEVSVLLSGLSEGVGRVIGPTNSRHNH